MAKLILDTIWTINSTLSVIISFISIIISVILAFKVEKLKAELEIEKNKAILNDSKIRKAYEDFISSFVDSNNQDKNWEINDWIKSFTKSVLLFSWQNTIHAINKYKTSVNKNRNEQIDLAENILFAMRQDLWVSNKWIKHWDLIQFLVKSDISSILNNKKD